MAGPQRTVLAQEAFKFNDVFGMKFAPFMFGSSVKRRLKLSEPEMSTDGGLEARQPIILAPDEENGRSLVVGWVDVPKKLAELRSFNVAKEQYEARYRSSIDIPREEWERVLAELNGFFRIQQLETTVVDTAVRPTEKQKAEKQNAEKTGVKTDPSIGIALVMLAIGILIGFGLGYLVFRLNVFMPA